MSRRDVLISAGELAGRLGQVILVDVGPREPDRAVGIVGANPADLGQVFAGAGGGTRGARPLPDIADLQRAVRGWGANDDSEIIVYDDRGGLNAARAWWTLKWAGLARVRLLDGGLQAAERAGIALEPLATKEREGRATLSGGRLPELDADAAAAYAREGRLLDARGAKAFNGDAETGEGGHIPGATSLPASGNLDADNLFLSDEALRRRFGLDGAAADLGVSCGSGVSAAHLAAALAILGVTPALYVGSWSAWSADPARPVAFGSVQPA